MKEKQTLKNTVAMNNLYLWCAITAVSNHWNEW